MALAPERRLRAAPRKQPVAFLAPQKGWASGMHQFLSRMLLIGWSLEVSEQEDGAPLQGKNTSHHERKVVPPHHPLYPPVS